MKTGEAMQTGENRIINSLIKALSITCDLRDYAAKTIICLLENMT